MSSVLLVLQLIVAIFLVAIILMQRSNGGALSGLGGGDGIGGLLSARSKGNILTRITAVLATMFFVLSLAISIYFSRMEVVRTSIVDGVVNNNAASQPIEAQETAPVEVPAEQTQEIPAVPTEAEVPAELAPSEAAPEAKAPAASAPAAQPQEAPAEPAEPEVPVAE